MQSTESTDKKSSCPKGGRPKGSLNKVSATAKENIIAVFTRLGGTAAMADWARENQSDFYKLYARLLPVEHTGEGGGPIRTRTVIEFVGS